jgi:hypothetical protein
VQELRRLLRCLPWLRHDYDCSGEDRGRETCFDLWIELLLENRGKVRRLLFC